MSFKAFKRHGNIFEIILDPWALACGRMEYIDLFFSKCANALLRIFPDTQVKKVQIRYMVIFCFEKQAAKEMGLLCP